MNLADLILPKIRESAGTPADCAESAGNNAEHRLPSPQPIAESCGKPARPAEFRNSPQPMCGAETLATTTLPHNPHNPHSSPQSRKNAEEAKWLSEVENCLHLEHGAILATGALITEDLPDYAHFTPGEFAAALDRLLSPEQRTALLSYAHQGPPAVTCGNCDHFDRIAHPNLGKCSCGEPMPPMGLWDSDTRLCPSHRARENQ